MRRTHVYLGKEELELLDRVAVATGASRSELIRRAVRRTYGTSAVSAKLLALETSAGGWTGRQFNGAEYVNSLRDDFNKRLSDLGLE